MTRDELLKAIAEREMTCKEVSLKMGKKEGYVSRGTADKRVPDLMMQKRIKNVYDFIKKTPIPENLMDIKKRKDVTWDNLDEMLSDALGEKQARGTVYHIVKSNGKYAKRAGKRREIRKILNSLPDKLCGVRVGIRKENDLCNKIYQDYAPIVRGTPMSVFRRKGIKTYSVKRFLQNKATIFLCQKIKNILDEDTSNAVSMARTLLKKLTSHDATFICIEGRFIVFAIMGETIKVTNSNTKRKGVLSKCYIAMKYFRVLMKHNSQSSVRKLLEETIKNKRWHDMKSAINTLSLQSKLRKD